nr:peptide deformylase [Pseudoruegeria sp. HB172150]
MPVLVYGDERLKQVARPVGEITDEIRRLAADMAETMYDAPGRGLAAPQVGVGLRLFVMDCHWKDGAERDPVVVIDPEIVWESEERATGEEGCLSIPGLPMDVRRPAEIRLLWRTLDGETVERHLTGPEARCAQHEYDHLDGVLITDRVPHLRLAALEPQLKELAAHGGTV